MTPPDMNPQRTAAWQALSQGATLTEAARAAADAVNQTRPYSAGTIAKWLGEWRQEHGDSLFRSEAALARVERTAAAREHAESMWVDYRAGEAARMGEAASLIRARILEILPTVGARWVDRGPDGTAIPLTVEGPDAREVLALANAAAKLVGTAEDLALPLGANPAGGAVHRPDVDLSGLEETPEHHQAQQAAIAVIAQFKARRTEQIAG